MHNGKAMALGFPREFEDLLVLVLQFQDLGRKGGGVGFEVGVFLVKLWLDFFYSWLSFRFILVFRGLVSFLGDWVTFFGVGCACGVLFTVRVDLQSKLEIEDDVSKGIW